MDIFFVYNITVSSLLLIIFVNFLVNNYLFRDISAYSISNELKKSPPLVSILVPARNEERNIIRCLRSLIRQDYPNFEIIVLDDNSTDQTAQIVNEYALKYGRIKLINGRQLPPGWLGKCFACQQLAEHANGKYLLFTDADTLHFKNSVSGALSAMLENNFDAISVFARQIMVTIHERMMVPFGNYLVLSFMPLVLISKSKNPLFSTAIGQFMLFKKEVYEKIGGHESIKNEILEDIHISKQVKKHGFRFMIFDGRNNFYCRMYKNLGEVINGYSKVIAASFNYNAMLQAIATSLIFLIYLIPFIILPLGIFVLDFPQILLNLIIGQIAIILTIKLIQTFRFKNRFIDIFLFPLSVIYILLISIHSLLKSKSASGVYWKGRTYDVRKEDELTLVKDFFHEHKK
jgi:chlorobactene glucosyltransferase